MPIFLHEGDIALKNKRFEIPTNLMSHLKNTLGQYRQYADQKGYKRLNALIFPDYNKRSNGASKNDGNSITFGDAKKIQSDMKSMNKKSLEYQMVGGGEMERALNGYMSTVRNMNQEVQAVKPVKPNSRGLKPASVKPTKLEKAGIHVHENRKIMHITEEQLNMLKNVLKP